MRQTGALVRRAPVVMRCTKATNPAHKRNGGRHCCQPPLRRAKDLPVFVTWLQKPEGLRNPLSILAHQLRRRFPSGYSPARGARLFYSTAPPEGSLVFRPARPGTGTEVPYQNRPMFRGPSWGNRSYVPLRSPSTSPPKRLEVRSRVAQEANTSSGASSRLAPLPLPKELRQCLPAEIGPLVTCRPKEAGTAVPITSRTMHVSAESQKRKIR